MPTGGMGADVPAQRCCRGRSHPDPPHARCFPSPAVCSFCLFCAVHQSLWINAVCSLAELLPCKHKKIWTGQEQAAYQRTKKRRTRALWALAHVGLLAGISARSWGNGRNSDFSPILVPRCPLKRPFWIWFRNQKNPTLLKMEEGSTHIAPEAFYLELSSHLALLETRACRELVESLPVPGFWESNSHLIAIDIVLCSTMNLPHHKWTVMICASCESAFYSFLKLHGKINFVITS